MAGAAFAEDIPLKAPPSAPTYNWTGLYFGSHVGAASSSNAWQDPTGFYEPFGADFRGRGVSGGGIFGLQGGYNWQMGNSLVGVEAELSSARIVGIARCGIAILICSTESGYLGTVAARYGIIAQDRVSSPLAGMNGRYYRSPLLFELDIAVGDTRRRVSISA